MRLARLLPRLFPRLLPRLLPILALVAACNQRPYQFLGDPFDARASSLPDGASSDGFALPPVGDASATDGGVCRPVVETCNGKDDDCDGVIDDGFDFNTDPANCGRCGLACLFANAGASCSLGTCRMDGCAEGFVDIDRLSVNGCECGVSNGGIEICDGKDNDCDGETDEGFDLDTDLANCGGCGRGCAFDHAVVSCEKGQCSRAACDAGFVDLDRVARNGCEYACTPTATTGGIETCDGKDNDCDGAIDEDDPLVGARCFPGGVAGCDVATGTCQGPCAFGAYVCNAGALVCRGAALPRPELCNALDDDCDGAADEDFDLANDPRTCGGCGRLCALPNAVNGCTAGACVVRSCLSGFVDLDGLASNGCEYACLRTGPEVCDGQDNDCDGQTDAADPDLLAPMVNFCKQTGECGKGPGGSSRFAEATFPVCTTAPGHDRPDWICNYPATVELFAANQVLGQESLCDGLDNDCDGAIDEHARPVVGGPCVDDGLGECRRVGVSRCAADPAAPPSCDTSAAPLRLPSDEICDGKDNDCDGHVDESWDASPASGAPKCAGAACRGVRDAIARVTAGGSAFWIHATEASRPDATVGGEGTSDGRACARAPGAALPWTNVTYAQAQAACAGAGMRLCRTARPITCSSTSPTTDEWGAACSAGVTCGGAARPYPYSCTYDAARCNGQDAGLGARRPSGALAMCTTGDLDPSTLASDAAYDLSGNLAEWTDDCRGSLEDGTGRRAYTLRGGSYTSLDIALACGFMALVVAEDFAFADTGFRCCSSCAPGQADCGPAGCVDLGSSAAHCGACGNACAAGAVCDNGRCQ